MEDNIFRVLRVDKRELSFSSFLKWVSTLDIEPNFVESLIKELNLSYEVNDIEVKREVEKANSIADLIIESENFLIVLENKVKSTERESQTEDLYNDWADTEREPIFIFLTPEYREGPECDEFTHMTYTQVRNILSELKENLENEKIKILVEDFIQALEVNKFVKFEKFSKESIEYLEEIEDFREKEKAWYSEVEIFFNEIKTRLKDKLSGDYKFDITKTSLKIGKEEWELEGKDKAYYKISLGDEDKRKGRISIYLSVRKRVKRRKELYKRFKEKTKEKNRPKDENFYSSKSHWWEEGYGDLFGKLKENEVMAIEEISGKLVNLIEETNMIVDNLLNQ